MRRPQYGRDLYTQYKVFSYDFRESVVTSLKSRGPNVETGIIPKGEQFKFNKSNVYTDKIFRFSLI